MKILLADDEPIARTMLEHWLTGWGYDVVSVKDGPSALNVLETTQDVRIAVLDWVMPGMDGVDICRRVRQGRKDSYVYVILLTARDDKNDISRGLEAGADDYLIKPCNPFELSVRLNAGKRVLELTNQLAQARAELENRAMRDALTGVLARGPALEFLERELSRAERTREPVGVLNIRVDQFEALRTERGGDVINRACEEVARRLGRATRRYDLLGRLADGEFLLVLPGCDAEVAVKVASRVRDALSGSPISVGTSSFRMTAGFGVASTSQRPGARLTQLVGAASQASHAAQGQGRDGVFLARPQEWQESEKAQAASSAPAA